MRNAVLLLQRQFRARESCCQVQEVRIIAEAARPSRYIHDFAVPAAFCEYRLRIVGMTHQRKHAVVVGTSIGHAGKLCVRAALEAVAYLPHPRG